MESDRFRLLGPGATNRENDFYVSANSQGKPEAGPKPASTSTGWWVRVHRLRGGYSDGVDVVTISNGELQLDVLPTRGMGIWQGFSQDQRLGWESPIAEPVHPCWVDPMRRGGIGWLDGFNEFIVRCGLGWHGAPGTDRLKDAEGNVVHEEFLPLHGRIANLPASRVDLEVTERELILTGVVVEGSLFGGKLELTAQLIIPLHGTGFRIEDRVRNAGGQAAEVEMLYHCNVGKPWVDQGTRLEIAAEELAPRDARAAEDITTWADCRAPEAGYAEQVYFFKPAAGKNGASTALLHNKNAGVGLLLQQQLTTLPWFVFWKNTQAEEDGYCCGLEPATSFPNLRLTEREKGRVRTLAPGETVSYEFSVDVLHSVAAIEQAVDGVKALQSSTACVVHSDPKSDWGG